MDKETLLKIAGLAKLEIDQKDIASTLEDFNKIMSYVEIVNEIDTSVISEDEIYYYTENRTREDVAGELLSKEDIASFSPKYENGYIVVPRVIENE